MEETILKNLDYLSKNLTNFPSLCERLYELSVLTVDEFYEMKSPSIEYKQEKALFSIIVNKAAIGTPFNLQNVLTTFIKCLRGSGNETVAKMLTTANLPTPGETRTTIRFDMKIAIENFEGREVELDQIEKYQTECQNTNGLCFVLITGCAGVGKSELAKQFAKKFDLENDGHIIWINGERNMTLISSFTRLSKTLMLSTGNKELEKTLEDTTNYIYHRIAHFRRRTLIIFDMVETLGHHIYEITRVWGGKSPFVIKPIFLFTSRNALISNFFKHPPLEIKLESLSPESAQKLIQQNCGHLRPENLENLCNNLKNHPLALQQTISLISGGQQIFSYALEKNIEYMRHDSRNSVLPQLKSKQIPPIIFKLWCGIKGEMRDVPKGGKQAIDVMNVLSTLSNRSIKKEFVRKFILLDNNDIFEILQNHAMIKLCENDEIEMHPSLQEVILINLEHTNELNAILDKSLQTTSKILSNDASAQDVHHFLTIWRHATKYKDLVEKHQEITCRIARNCYETKKFRQMLDFTTVASNVMEEYIGIETRWKWAIKFWKGLALQSLGKYDEALEVLRFVHENQVRFYGEISEDPLKTARYIARVYHRKEMMDKALEWYRDTLEKRRKQSTEENLETLLLQNNIAVIVEGQKKYAEAQKLYVDVLKLQKSILGVEHPEIANTEQDIGNTLSKQGKYDDAMVMYRRVLAERLRILGQEHSLTITTKHNIACTLMSQGEYEEALKVFEEVLQVEKRIHGNEHDDTLITMSNIAVTQKHLGKLDEALQMYTEVLDVRGKLLGMGEDHPETINTRKTMASTLYNKGEYNEALTIYEDVLSFQKKNLGRLHPDTLKTHLNILITMVRICFKVT